MKYYVALWLIGWVWALQDLDDGIDGLTWFAGPVLLVIWPIRLIERIVFFIIDYFNGT